MNKVELREEAMSLFSEKGIGSVRAFKGNGEAWFSAKDACNILEITNSRDATSTLDDDEKMTVGLTDSHSGKRGGAQSMTLINTSGLYCLIFRSRKPQAKAFKRWVTRVVLPSIMEGKNQKGAFAYIYGQEELDEPEPEGDKAAMEKREAILNALDAAKKAAEPPKMFAVINGFRMTVEEARNWDFD